MQLSNYAGVHADLSEAVVVSAGSRIHSPMSFPNNKYCCGKLSLIFVVYS